VSDSAAKESQLSHGQQFVSVIWHASTKQPAHMATACKPYFTFSYQRSNPHCISWITVGDLYSMPFCQKIYSYHISLSIECKRQSVLLVNDLNQVTSYEQQEVNITSYSLLNTINIEPQEVSGSTKTFWQESNSISSYEIQLVCGTIFLLNGLMTWIHDGKEVSIALTFSFKESDYISTCD
jgi:hypothetical protein